LREHPVSSTTHFTLLDFNEETLKHVVSMLNQIKHQHNRSTQFQFIKRSVNQLLKEASRPTPQSSTSEQFDFIYCAGLFDYLSDIVCKRLMDMFYGMLAPGGLLVATNVSDALNTLRPFRYSMEYILDWHLIYRDGPQVATFAPELAPPESSNVISEDTGTNVFIEVRKP
jgi:extracellular factor (EF) 3-hydroxypalmitic acid methyl ester biosynthesis protein